MCVCESVCEREREREKALCVCMCDNVASDKVMCDLRVTKLCVWVELYVTKLYVTKWSDKVVRERLCATKLCVKGFCMRKLRRRVVCDQVVCDKEERDKVVCVKDYVWQEGRGGGGSRRRDTEPKTRTPHKDVRSVRQFQRKFLTGYASYSNGAGRAPERLVAQRQELCPRKNAGA